MSTIEEKLLDGPRVDYCDSEARDARVEDDNRVATESRCTRNDVSSLFVRPEEGDQVRHETRSNSTWSKNTGPKGVIEDSRKQALKKYQSQNVSQDDVDELESEFQALLNDDSILKEFVSKRILQKKQEGRPTFGQIEHLHYGSQLLDAIDKEDPSVSVIVHIYTKYSRPCSALNQCLSQLAKDMNYVRFVTLEAGAAGLSANFKENGVPALLAYRGGELVKSLVKLEDYVDKDFELKQIKELIVDNILSGSA